MISYIASLNNYAKKDLLEADQALYGQSPQRLSIHDLAIEPGNVVDIESPYYTGTEASNILVHPSVLHTPDGCAGGQWQYLMAVTPFANGSDQTENPCIFVSNDLRTWVEPDGVTMEGTGTTGNPLVPTPSGGYNSDTHLYKHTDGYFYQMYRSRITGVSNSVYCIRSADGVSWSAPVTILTANVATEDWASPSFWHDGTNWVMIAHDIVDAGFRVRKLVKTGEILESWAGATTSTLTITHPSGTRWWHSDIHRMPDGRLIGLALDYVASGGSLFLWQSDDAGVNWSVRQVTRSRNYRSCLVLRENDVYGMIVWINADASSATMNCHKFTMGQIRQRRLRALTSALSTYSLNLIEDTASLVSYADGFAGALAALSGSWTQHTGTNLNRNGSGLCVAAGVGTAAASVQTSTIDHEVQAKFNAYAAGGMYLMLRYVDTSNHILVGVNAGTGAVAVRTVVAGVTTNDLSLTPNPVLAVPSYIRAVAQGKWLDIYINNEFQGSLEIPSTLMAGTRAGLYITGSTGNQFDEFMARPI